MEIPREQFDELLGGTEQLPSVISITKFANARSQEIIALTEAIGKCSLNVCRRLYFRHRVSILKNCLQSLLRLYSPYNLLISKNIFTRLRSPCWLCWIDLP